MNGQLKMLAARFLESAGGIPAGWLDIVTSLSWEAALVIRPDDGASGNDMDPSSYVKVKCLASGTRRQSEVIRGLVFKKNAAHKHMPTRCHSPRLLLLRGVLGDSDNIAFSSFSSIEQEKDQLDKSVCKMMDICRPNVIMVEKTVSRDIQELLLKQGVTLIIDMKLNRLQKIARCSGSPILSFSEVLSRKPKLRQCDYFHIDKVPEEHNHSTTVQAGKIRQSKTLMFLEGFHKPLGCTILLRGANSEELKKVKQVMHYTVFAAYHLVLETSFFEDQRVLLNNKNASKVVSTKAESPVVHRIISAPSIGSHLVGPKDNDAKTVTISPTKIQDLNPFVPNDEPPEGPVIYYDSKQEIPPERLASSVSGSPRRSIDIFRHQNIYLPVTSSQEETENEDDLQYSQDMTSYGLHIMPSDGSYENLGHLSDPWNQAPTESNEKMTLHDHAVSGEQQSTSYISGDKTSDTDEVDDILESQSILILLSSQCITKQVLARGVMIFSEVTGLLQDLKDQVSDMEIYNGAFIPIKEFSQLEDLLIKEKSEFMCTLAQAVDGTVPSSVHEILNVNWLYQYLLLELYVWDRRLHQLLRCISAEKERIEIGVKETSEFTGEQTAVVAEVDDIAECTGRKASLQPEKFSEPGIDLLDENAWDKHNEEAHRSEVHFSGISNCLDVQSNGLVARSMSPKQEQLSIPQQFRLSQWDWVWNPLPESRLAYRQELEVGCLERFELINRYCPSHLSPLHKHKQSAEEFTVGPGGNVLCVSEDEISSIISRALAISEERRHLLDAITESEPADNRAGERIKTMEKSYSSVSESSSASSSWSSTLSSTGSSDSEAATSSDDLSSYESSLLPSSLHPEISVNGSVALRGKYSVICVHSNQFYNLRKKCCPSELAYITSLSRCKKWDAQGGKSKAFFAKTVDDRFIIKQIKKTEFESFIKFASDYFKHAYYSLDTGSQTCLAKILGIYQVFHMLLLQSINVMDYSLLVGVDKQKHELVFGIIDYLRQYTWDKQLETWVKTSLVVPKNESPTVISPREYKKRFRKFMSKYFLTVPDDWSKENRPVSCKSCAHAGSTKWPGVMDEKPPQHPNPNTIVACA
ncbi:hypothetical protein HU200_058128 [Digitaria exilis]|uniref:1-phosphatidylinositol-3-phosphate 5-kinase n=1 Tax=Digitaria exilis TaxID=1010633 RepID=A0A835AED4_9POAL|nr:hypothetical protein HU200_058128 [Digitaria exilis]